MIHFDATILCAFSSMMGGRFEAARLVGEDRHDCIAMNSILWRTGRSRHEMHERKHGRLAFGGYWSLLQ